MDNELFDELLRSVEQSHWVLMCSALLKADGEK